MFMILLLLSGITAKAQKPIFSSPAFNIYPDKVVQGKFTAKAVSRTEMQSNYKSPANLATSANLVFKFSVNGRDNEMIPGMEHHFTVIAKKGYAETPVITFGKQLNQPEVKGATIPPNTPVTFRVDMSELIKAIDQKGYYETLNGDRIYKSDFHGVFIAGPTAPMTWDFDNLVNHGELRMKDKHGNGIFEVTLMMNKKADEKITDSVWKLTKDISAYPQYNSGFPISDAIYNLSLEEMTKAIEPDSTFRTGKEWGGVWTRDISYSIILSMAFMQPGVAKNSLLRKVNGKKKIIQDTGTGGSWPISTDRMIWAVAAWELYKTTGDRDWLTQAYEIVKNSIDADLEVVHDPETGLVKGESSFLDWREQTYPKWMQPADIYESECLGTNAVHYQANHVLSLMAAELGKKDEADKYEMIAERIKKGINTYLWIPEQGYYAQFLYGRNYKIPSPRSEALGEALCVIFGIADAARAKIIVQRTPVTTYGISCIYPQIPNIPPYHNDAIWPFVQTYWLWAAAKTGNEKSVMESISDIYRPAALFLTNKENFVVENGDFNGTQINSSIMLWSLSGNISLVQRILFGARIGVDDLSFEPFVPKALAGKRSLKNFKYRNATFDIEMNGFGSRIASFSLDGKTHAPKISSQLTGKHVIKILLANNTDLQPINKAENKFSIQFPHPKQDGDSLKWEAVKGATNYNVYLNGKLYKSTEKTAVPISNVAYAEYSVVAYAGKNDKVGSFASEPVEVISGGVQRKFQMELFASPSDNNYMGANGKGFIETSTDVNKVIEFPLNISTPGTYAIRFRYANGNGPGNTDNKCAVRSVYVDQQKESTVVFPQRGKNEWANWGLSNPVHLSLNPGEHVIRLKLENYDENMNGNINQAMLDEVTVTKISN
jgi:hypothetical protein